MGDAKSHEICHEHWEKTREALVQISAIKAHILEHEKHYDSQMAENLSALKIVERQLSRCTTDLPRIVESLTESNKRQHDLEIVVYDAVGRAKVWFWLCGAAITTAIGFVTYLAKFT